MRPLHLSLVLTFTVLTATNAHAAGFQLKEQGSQLQGLSFAGATAKADDVSTLFYNPAGIMRLGPGEQASSTASFIVPSAQIDLTSVTAATGSPGSPAAANGNGGDTGVAALVPVFYYARDIAPDWRGGVAVNVPFGLSTKYSNGWAGRYYALESSVQTINIAPTIAHQLTPTLSIGANVQAQYIKAKLTNAVNIDAISPFPNDAFAELKGDDISFGAGLGLLWEPRKDTRVGFNYRSRIDHKLKGDLTLTNVPGALAGVAALQNAKVSAAVDTPDILSLGIVHEIDDQWSVMGDVAYTNWSLFKNLIVRQESNGTARQSVYENWRDTVFVALGTEYKYSDDWTFRGGVAFDQAAVKTDTRTFRIPETDRFWVSGGATYAVTPDMNIDLGYTHIFARDARITEDDAPATNGIVSGVAEGNVDIVTAGVTWKF